jgi:undecaprenyl-diphosphatase
MAWRRVCLSVAFITMLAATILGLIAYGDNSLAIDIRVLERVQKVQFAGVDVITDASNMAFGTILAVTFIVTMLVYGIATKTRVLVAQLMMLVTFRLVGELLKPGFQSPRPGPAFQCDPEYVWTTLGYPSGHTFTATLVAGMIVLLAARPGVPRLGRLALALVAATIIAVASFSRIWVGAHWPTDTLGGTLFGAAAVTITWWATSFMRSAAAAPPSER